jgi:transcriptional regulator with XRE-family HTH domain
VSEDPTVQRRRLRVELRELRKKSGETQREIADAMDWSLSKTIRIENGEVSISANDLRQLLSHYNVTDQRRVSQLVDMAKASRSDAWPELRNLFGPADLSYFSFEGAASTQRTFQNALISGLLQTDEYARAIMSDELGYSEAQIERGWQARQRRQELHDREDPPQMHFIYDEAVVRRLVGGAAAMRRQLEQLKRFGQLDHITIQVLPFSVGAHRSMRGPFILLEFDDPKDDDLLYQEQASNSTTTRDDPTVVADYLELFYELEQKALSPAKTVDLLDKLIAEMGGSKPAARSKQEVAG